MMTEEEREDVRMALDVIRQYRRYAEAMRQLGRGFEPTGPKGESIATVVACLERHVAPWSAMTYEEAHRAHRGGRLTDDQWTAYKCRWRRITPRFSTLAAEHDACNGQCGEAPGGAAPEDCEEHGEPLPCHECQVREAHRARLDAGE
jgi:hypothetical protein